jgi:hypothetical protein
MNWVCRVQRWIQRSWFSLLRLIIVIGVLGSLPLIGYLSPRRRPEFVAIVGVAPIVCAIGLTLLTASNPLPLGAVGIVLTAALVRFSVGTGTGSSIVASMIVTAGVLGIWVVRMLVVEKQINLTASQAINVPLIGFVLTCVVSYAWSNVFRDVFVITWDSWPFVQLGSLAVMALLPGATLLAANTLTDLKWVRVLFGTIVGIGTLQLIIHYFHLPVRFIQTKGQFTMWVVAFCWAQVLFNQQMSKGKRLLLLALVVGWFYKAFVQETSWLSGWVPTALAVGILSTLRSRKLFLLLVLLVIVFGVLRWDMLQEVWAAEKKGSGITRLAAWEVVGRLVGKHLLFGMGPAGYAVYYMTYFPWEGMATHNNYIDLIAQTGIVGTFFYLWLFGSLVWTGWLLTRRLRERRNFEEGSANAAFVGCLGCLSAMMLGDWMLPFAYTQTIAGFDYAVYNWIGIGTIIAMSKLTAQAETSAVGSSSE